MPRRRLRRAPDPAPAPPDATEDGAVDESPEQQLERWFAHQARPPLPPPADLAGDDGPTSPLAVAREAIGTPAPAREDAAPSAEDAGPTDPVAVARTALEVVPDEPVDEPLDLPEDADAPAAVEAPVDVPEDADAPAAAEAAETAEPAPVPVSGFTPLDDPNWTVHLAAAAAPVAAEVAAEIPVPDVPAAPEALHGSALATAPALLAEPTVEPVVVGVVDEQVVEPALEPLADLATVPVAEPVEAWPAEPADELVAEPVADPRDDDAADAPVADLVDDQPADEPVDEPLVADSSTDAPEDEPLTHLDGEPVDEAPDDEAIVLALPTSMIAPRESVHRPHPPATHAAPPVTSARPTPRSASATPVGEDPDAVEFRSGEAPRRLFGAAFVVAAVGSVLAIFAAVDTGTGPALLLSAVLVAACLASWWALIGWSPTVVSIRHGSLEVARGASTSTFDLRDPGTTVETRGDSRSPSWRAVVSTRSGRTVVVNRRQVRPRQFLELVEHHRETRRSD